MIEQAHEFLHNGDYASAEVLYREMLAEEPDNPEVLFMLAVARQGQGDLDEPVTLLRHALRVQPRNPSLHNALGLLCLRRRELDEAERSFHAAVGIDPNFVTAQNGIASVELARGRFAAAEHALRRALKVQADHPATLLNLGIALLEQERTGEALAHLQSAANLEPDNFAVQYHLGRAFLAAGNQGFAIQCFANALRLKPGSVDALERLAEAEYRSGHWKEAAAHCQALLELGAETADIVAMLARCHARRGRRREAEGAFLRALRLSGGSEEIALDLARLYLDAGRPGEATARLEPLFGNAGDRPRMARLLAEAALQSGQAARAIQVLRPVVSEGAPDPRLRMLLARALAAGGEHEAAAAQVGRLLELDPQPVDAVLFQAASELAAGQRDRAIERLRGVQRRHDLDPAQRQQAVSILGDALHAGGQYRAAWEQYLGLAPRQHEVLAIRAEAPLQLETNEAPETAMVREVAWSWPPQAPDDGRREPIFVFGWPGSGRSDLLRALAGHRGICVVDGGPAAQRERRAGISHPQGAGPLGALPVARVQLARRKYWKALQRLDSKAGQVATVDALWLAAEALPTIYRLFPQAHLVVLAHDPRDLAVAWMRSGLGPLEAMAQGYVRQLELLEACRGGVPLNYVELDARELAETPGTALRHLVSALSLAWDAGVETAFRAQPPGDLAEAGSARHYAPWMGEVFDSFGMPA